MKGQANSSFAASASSCNMAVRVLLIFQIVLHCPAFAAARDLQDSGGWQSSLGGSSSYYASAADYNAASQTLRIAGGTTTTCFLATFDLTSGNVVPVIDDQIAVNASSCVQQACTSMAVDGDQVYLAGYQVAPTNISGLLFEANPGVETFPTAPKNLFTTSTTAIVYPVAFVASKLTADNSEETFFAVSIDTADTSRNAYPKEADPTRDFPFGNSFDISIHRIQRYLNQTKYTLQNKFITFSTVPTPTATGGVSIYASGIAHLRDDLLVVVGSSAAQGIILGTKKIGSGTDVDGFVVKLDASLANPPTYVYAGDQVHVTRIESVNQRDDFVTALCYNKDDPSSIYLVGTTSGQMKGAGAQASDNDTTDAYLIKMKVDTLTVVWTAQLGGSISGNVTGVACAVTPDGQDVWFTGTVHNGAFMAGTTSMGKDDIFIAQVNVGTGSLLSLKQMGTTEDDGVGALAMDPNGNVFLTGHTFGSWFRSRPDTATADLFVTKVLRTTATPVALPTSFVSPPTPTPVIPPSVATGTLPPVGSISSPPAPLRPPSVATGTLPPVGSIPSPPAPVTPPSVATSILPPVGFTPSSPPVTPPSVSSGPVTPVGTILSSRAPTLDSAHGGTQLPTKAPLTAVFAPISSNNVTGSSNNNSKPVFRPVPPGTDSLPGLQTSLGRNATAVTSAATDHRCGGVSGSVLVGAAAVGLLSIVDLVLYLGTL